jgi:hypothetical protein
MCLPTGARRAKDGRVNAYHTLVALAPATLLAACASTTDYPSLAQRPVERVEGAFATEVSAPTPTPPPALSADLAARLADLQRDASSLHAQFVDAAPTATRLAAAAGPTGSDSWASAQVAVADLDSLRSRVAVSLADLDALWVDSKLENNPREAIGAARDSVEGLVAQEDQVLARLRSRVAP